MDRFTVGKDYRLGGAYSPDPVDTQDAVDKAYEFIYQFHEQHGYAPNAEFVGESTEVHQDQVQEAFEIWNKEEELEAQRNKVYLREVG